MFKVIVMLDCNLCGQPLDSVATSTDRDPMVWKALSQDLEDTAERRGWSFYRSAHHCHYCISDMTFSLGQAAHEAREAKKTGLE